MHKQWRVAPKDDVRGWHFVIYPQTFNIRGTLVGYKIVDHSDVIGASPVGAAPTTSSFSTSHLASMDWAKTTIRRDEKHISFGFDGIFSRW